MHSIKPSALVVDDEALVAMYLAETLEEMGFDVSTAGTADEALHITQLKGAFTVAFIDLGLPGRSGLELMAELQILHPEQPIVIASGYGLMAERDVDDNNRAPAVLPKPYNGQRVAGVLIDLGIPIPHIPVEE